LYSWNIELFDSGTVPIAAISSNKHGFYASVGFVKKVEVVVNNGPWGMPSMWGDCYWIRHPFGISLLNEQGSSLTVLTQTSPPVTHVFDVPNTWNSLAGVRIDNPETFPVAVEVTVIFHSQIPNLYWQTIFYIGLISTAIGIILTGVAVRKKQTIYKPPPP